MPYVSAPPPKPAHLNKHIREKEKEPLNLNKAKDNSAGKEKIAKVAEKANKKTVLSDFDDIKKRDKVVGVLSVVCIVLFVLCSCLLLSLSNKQYFVIGETENGRSLLSVTQDGANQTTLTIPDGVEYIGQNAFLNSILTLVEINIPASVVEIEAGAFMGCVNLERVNFKGASKLERVGEMAFAGCYNLQDFTINQINKIYFSSSAFEGCSDLVITFKNKFVPEEEPFWASDYIKAIIVPSGLIEDFKAGLGVDYVYSSKKLIPIE